MTGALAATAFSFESVRLDRAGNVVTRTSGSARSHREVLAAGVALELVHIPGGRYEMGAAPGEEGAWRAEAPRHAVGISSFLLGKTPVTQAQWSAVAELPAVEQELDPSPSRFSGADHPVEGLRWIDSVEFCARLSARTGREFRLPSEAEWEYACRAGTRTAFHCGETLTREVANTYSELSYGGAPAGTSLGKTTPVASYPANPFGLYDMHGNVFEWCADVWHVDYEAAPADAKPWTVQGVVSYRPLRGGAWCTRPHGCRSAARSAAHRSNDHRINTYGLRVALSP